jgi:hypothetical protein
MADVAEPTGTPASDDEPVTKTTGDPADAKMWTARLRRRVVQALPPDRLLPDRQPAYVASWIYVFGVATVAALVVVFLTAWHVLMVRRRGVVPPYPARVAKDTGLQGATP